MPTPDAGASTKTTAAADDRGRLERTGGADLPQAQARRRSPGRRPHADPEFRHVGHGAEDLRAVPRARHAPRDCSHRRPARTRRRSRRTDLARHVRIGAIAGSAGPSHSCSPPAPTSSASTPRITSTTCCSARPSRGTRRDDGHAGAGRAGDARSAVAADARRRRRHDPGHVDRRLPGAGSAHLRRRHRRRTQRPHPPGPGHPRSRRHPDRGAAAGHDPQDRLPGRRRRLLRRQQTSDGRSLFFAHCQKDSFGVRRARPCSPERRSAASAAPARRPGRTCTSRSGKAAGARAPQATSSTRCRSCSPGTTSRSESRAARRLARRHTGAGLAWPGFVPVHLPLQRIVLALVAACALSTPCAAAPGALAADEAASCSRESTAAASGEGRSPRPRRSSAGSSARPRAK